VAEHRDLSRFAWFSIALALGTMGAKAVAWQVTNSVGLLSDTLESSVNLAAAIVMLIALRVSALPPDENHHFGHEKAEQFSAAAEGLMIVGAATAIVASAVDRLLEPAEVERVGVGLGVSAGATLLNLLGAVVLLRAGRLHRSAAITADGKHLLTDVWTSAGVIVGVLAVAGTGWQRLDPLIALAVGVNIVVTGVRLLGASVHALMDPPLDDADQAAIDAVIDRYRARGIVFHAMRSRVAGSRRFFAVHVLVPGHWSVAQGHALLEHLEADLRDVVDGLVVFTHLEPVEDPSSYLDEHLDRADPPATPAPRPPGRRAADG
jgi:cation diffusion facilitator family transporter